MRVLQSVPAVNRRETLEYCTGLGALAGFLQLVDAGRAFLY